MRSMSGRAGRWLARMGGLLALAAVNLWMIQREQRAQRLLSEAAVPGDAEIVRRFLAPNGVTARLEYLVTATDECVVFFERAEPFYARSGLTADFIS